MKWFPHDTNTRDDDKIFELIDRHGLQGYGFFWVILEECYDAEEAGFQVEVSDTWCKRIAKEFGLTDSRTIVRLLDTLAEVQLIDAQMWNEKIIFVPGIQKRSDGYMKKKQDAAKRKREQREREKEAKQNQTKVTPMSRVTDCDKANVTPSDLRSQISEDQNLENLNPVEDHKNKVISSADADHIFDHPIEPEILEPEPQPQSAAQNSHAEEPHPVKPRNSGKGKSSAETLSEDKKRFMDTYNRLKPSLWAEMQVVTAKRWKVFEGLAKEYGGRDQAIEVLSNALRCACSEKWFKTRALTFENFASKEKITQLHERWLCGGDEDPASQIDAEMAHEYSSWMETLTRAAAEGRIQVNPGFSGEHYS